MDILIGMTDLNRFIRYTVSMYFLVDTKFCTGFPISEIKMIDWLDRVLRRIGNISAMKQRSKIKKYWWHLTCSITAVLIENLVVWSWFCYFLQSWFRRLKIYVFRNQLLCNTCNRHGSFWHKSCLTIPMTFWFIVPFLMGLFFNAYTVFYLILF